MRARTGFLLAAIAAAIFSFPLASSADDGQGSSASQDGYASSLPDGTVDCFDYYKFQSVQVDVSPNLRKTIPGTTLGFEGEIRNRNGYPVVGGSVYAKIFRIQKDESIAHAQGHDLVDQLFVKEDINLKAGETSPVAFTWDVPTGAETGDYEIAMYFQSDRKFNLLGLSFTDDVAGNKSTFHIDGNDSSVRLSKEGVTVNGQKFAFASYLALPYIGNEDQAAVKFSIVNASKEDRFVPVTYDLYSGDGLREENLRDSKSETVSLAPGEKKELQYLTDKKGFPNNYLVIAAGNGDAKSILDIRFVREGESQLTIGFPSSLSYPLEKGKEASFFACVNDSGSSDSAANGRVVMTVLSKGKKLFEKEYQGKITDSMMAVKGDFVPKETYADFDLKTDIYQDGNLADSQITHYGCDAFGQSCPEESKSFGNIPNAGKGILILTVALISLALAASAAFAYRRKMRKSKIIKILAFLLIAGGTFLFSDSAKAEKSVVTESSGCFIGQTFWMPAHSPMWAGTYYGNAYTSATYRARVVDADSGNEIADRSVLRVGQKIRFETLSSGYAVSRIEKRRIVGIGGGVCDNMDINASSPIVSRVYSGPLSCDSGGVCTIQGSGSVSARITFGSATGSIFWSDSYVGPEEAAVDYAGGTCGFSFPQSYINFTFTAVNPNNVPSVPTISGPQRVLSGSSNAYSFLSTDPERNRLRYQIDWNGDGTADAYAPATGYVDSGVSGSAKYKAPSAGYSIKARACDDQGTDHCSAWSAPYAVTIYANGECGSSNGGSFDSPPSKNLCSSGTASTVSLSGYEWRWICKGLFGGSNVSCTASKPCVPSNAYSCSEPSCDPSECGQKAKSATCLANDGCGHVSAVPLSYCGSSCVAATKVLDCGVCNSGNWTER